MRIVEQANFRPHHCAMYPTLGASHRKGYFDTGSELAGFDNHAYVSVEFVEQAALQLGWLSPEGKAELERDVEDLIREKGLLEDQLQEADKFAEAAEYTLNNFNTRVKAKPGPKRKQGEDG